MIHIYVCSGENEIPLFHNLERELSDNSMWQRCDLYTTQTVEKWIRWIQENYPADILVCDVTKKGAITALKMARKKHAEALIIPVADQTVRPSDYVRPDILPYTLLWKPLTRQGLRETFLNILPQICREEDTGPEKSFELVTKQETRYIPYRDILYFEACEKKIFLRMKNQEVCFYGTLSKLEAQLPGDFIRCHKSYIINCLHIAGIRWSDQVIYMGENITIPLSRTYKNRFREGTYGRETV